MPVVGKQGEASARAIVAHLTSAHPVGDARIFHKECTTLVQAGYEVVLIAPAERDHVVDGIRILAVKRESARLRRFLLAPWRVFRRALRCDAQVFHFHDPEMIPAALLLRFLGRRVIYDIHEDVPRLLLGRAWLPRPLRKSVSIVWELFENLAAHAFSARVAATEHIAARFGARRTIVVRNFPDPEEFLTRGKTPAAGRDFTFLYVGTLSASRGVMEIMQALNLAENARVRLRLAGKFSEPGLREQCERQPAWRRSEYLGWLQRVEVIRAMCEADAGLVLLHPTPAYQDAWPLKLFEYMAAGLPVIAADLPLMRRIVMEARCGILVDPLKPAEIARAMDWLATHPDEARAMGRRGRALVEMRYNWKMEGERLVNLYGSLLTGKPSCM